MHKKFLRTFAMSVVFLGVLGTIGITNAYGMYTEALEREVTLHQCKHIICRPKLENIRIRAITNVRIDYQRSASIGSQSHASAPCKRCQRALDVNYPNPNKKPQVQLSKSTKKTTITIGPSEEADTFKICTRANLKHDGYLEILYIRIGGKNSNIDLAYGLKRLFMEAYSMDIEHAARVGLSGRTDELTPLTGREFVVEKECSCSCCTLL